MGCHPYACYICGGGDYRCPTGEHDDGDCYSGCWEDDCVLIPGSVVWPSPRLRRGSPPQLADHYPAYYGGYGDFTVPGGPSNVAFYTRSDIEGFGLSEIVRDLDASVEFLVACRVACATCWQAKQKVDAAAAPATVPTGAAISDEDDSATKTK